MTSAPAQRAPAATSEPATGPGERSPVRRALAGAACAVAFLTILRVRSNSADLGGAAGWFPAVGAIVGAVAGATRYYGETLFGPTVASVLALAVLVILTGALHQDGLADCADGLGARGGRERRLAVMRDPATGVFGTLALVGWALLLTGTLAQLDSGEALRALVVAAVVARAAALLHAAATPPARSDGLGAAFDPGPASLAMAAVTALAAAILIAGPVEGFAVIAVAGLVALSTSAGARALLGGRTGDSLGATVAVAEIAICLTLLAFATA